MKTLQSRSMFAAGVAVAMAMHGATATAQRAGEDTGNRSVGAWMPDTCAKPSPPLAMNATVRRATHAGPAPRVREIPARARIEATGDYAYPAHHLPWVTHASDGYGTGSDDRVIAAAVLASLDASTLAHDLVAHVQAEHGRVTIHGTAGSTATALLAARLAGNTPGVVWVNNQLIVTDSAPFAPAMTPLWSLMGGPPAPSHAAIAPDAPHGALDEWITSEVKSTFRHSGRLNPGAISVSTREGVVSLAGAGLSVAERDLAVTLSQTVSGVRGIRSVGLVTIGAKDW